jgi:hypothetical protein
MNNKQLGNKVISYEHMFGKKISHFVIVVSIMFVIFFAMLWKSM